MMNVLNASCEVPLANMVNTPSENTLKSPKKYFQAILSNLRSIHDDVNLYAAFCIALAGFLGNSHGLSQSRWI